ncbi:MAG: nuclear transport factor 2 family protein [Crocinitomicaceae bacterium]
MKELDAKMNQWHSDVAHFKLDAYFDFMADDFIFLGTAPGERWTKAEFYKFSEPYFDQKSTWDFKTIDRHWYYSENGKIAWFEEDLDTWMEDCRGSGVLIFVYNQWQIAHYNLTVLIENEKVQEFISLRKK